MCSVLLLREEARSLKPLIPFFTLPFEWKEEMENEAK
jgi:hypothetical protein